MIITPQYIFLKCPKISHLEWHPFTLTSVSLLSIKQLLKVMFKVILMIKQYFLVAWGSFFLGLKKSRVSEN